MSRIDEAINEVWETSSELLANDARAELATLRLEHDALIAMGKQCASLRADLQAAQERIAEQARQLDAAREIIGVAKNDYQSDVQDGVDSYDKGQRCIDWLAANPAPEAEQPQQAKNQDDDYRDYEAENEETLWTYHHDPDHGL